MADARNERHRSETRLTIMSTPVQVKNEKEYRSLTRNIKKANPQAILKKSTLRQVAALNLAIKALTERRRKLYATGEAAFVKGIDFTFAVDGHKHYTEHSQAIKTLEDLIEILTDPGAVIDEDEYKQEAMI
jgi:hypothetical protein